MYNILIKDSYGSLPLLNDFSKKAVDLLSDSYEIIDWKFIPTQEETYEIYTVRDNDTLERVAAKFLMTPSSLMSINKLSSRTLFVNQNLKVNVLNNTNVVENVEEDKKNLSQNNADFKCSQNSYGERPFLPLNNHMKSFAKYITESEGIIKGKLLVTSSFLTFIPAFTDPVVIECGNENFVLHIPNNKIRRTHLYSDSSMIGFPQEKRVEDSPSFQKEGISETNSEMNTSCPDFSEKNNSLVPESYTIQTRSSSRENFLNRSSYVENLQKTALNDYKYLCVMVCPKYHKKTAVSQKNNEFWFVIPSSSAQSLMDYLISQTNIYIDKEGDGIETVDYKSTCSPDKNILRSSQHETEEFENIPNDNYLLERLNSEQELEFNKGKIISVSQVREIIQCLPSIIYCESWQLVYTTDRDGWSLSTLYRNVHNSTKEYFLLLIEDSQMKVFGAFCSSSIHLSTSFYGNGLTFVFRFNPHFEKFTYSKKNEYFMYGQANYFSIGSSNSNNAIRIEKTLFNGVTQACETFNSPPLVEYEHFNISRLEVWSLY